MNNSFIEAFNRFKFLKIQDLSAIFRFSSFKSFKKGEIIAREGHYCEHVFMIRKGIIRTYILTPDAEEKTIKLAKEKGFTACANSFLYQKPSTEYLEAIEDCKVFAFNIKKINEAASSNIRIMRLLHESLKEAMAEAVERVEFFTILSPEQRYERLLEESPDLIQRVPQKFLASYIGVTTVSLSRIRNRIISK
ncbi:hypothetical protein IMCC3317_00470 [Kordia antarctica]|uniref:Cyclic nucleotide-binding domain-containing protein n=1 Tax=Kordia antarctica TaxID=1218801 RepID=A0A7L4ZFH2_9FLAO|nr:Crp/Fnr family transcriptional regulator [Kordia antarctica]QHI34704.1 hypothetical protein IMCC3317_00470 [Kordia antarctica]